MPRREAPRQPLSISLNVKLGGEGGIRTLEPLRVDGLVNRCFRPLSHLSRDLLYPILLRDKILEF